VNCRLFAFRDWDISLEMRFLRGNMQMLRKHLASTLLVFFHIVICCVSLAYITQLFDTYHLSYNSDRLLDAILIVTAFALASFLFTFADFSFGYLVGFYLYTMVLGYLWLNCFSDFSYNREVAGLSAAVSAIAFLLPALFISSPIRQSPAISPRTFDRLLTVLFLLSLTTVAIGASYNFQFVSPRVVSSLRSEAIPVTLRYLIGITSSVLLPFLFACFVARKNYWQAAATLSLLLFYYPVAMSKITLFAPAWLVFMVLLSRIFKARDAVVLSLSGPVLVGVILLVLFRYGVIPSNAAIPYFETINFRMIAVPSSAMDVYNDFFSKHDFTYFCQIQVLKSLTNCPYQEQLSIVMMHAYPFGGNFNASLFATEGIASVGLLLAPVSVFACGLVIALGNRLSAGLPPSFILVSGAILPQVLLNVPFSTALLTHGAAFLFLLWYVTPRSMFGQDDGTNINCGSADAPKAEELDGTREIACADRSKFSRKYSEAAQ
jgi:hypothetical protein